jgi:hypothetical protein
LLRYTVWCRRLQYRTYCGGTVAQEKNKRGPSAARVLRRRPQDDVIFFFVGREQLPQTCGGRGAVEKQEGSFALLRMTASRFC